MLMCFYAHETAMSCLVPIIIQLQLVGNRVLLSTLHCELPIDWKEMNKLLITRTIMQREAVTSTLLDMKYIIQFCI